MDKNKYYVNLQAKEIATTAHGNNNDFVIYATDEEARNLRNTFNQMHDGEMASYWRAHVPIMPYHHDKGNQKYDTEIQEAFKQIHLLGDEDTKAFIEESGYLN